MPTNLTEVSTYAATVAVPADGDARTAASVVTPFQVLADRTKYFKTLTDGGVLRVQNAADLTALRLIEGAAEGDVCIMSGGHVLYTWSVSSTDTDDSRYVIKPTATAGAGRWLDVVLAMLELRGGVYRLVPKPANAIVSQGYSETASGSSDNFTVSALPFGPTISMTLKAADVVMLDGFANFDPQSYTSGRYAVSLQETHSAVTTILTNSIREVALADVRRSQPLMSPMTRYTVPSDDTYTFQMVAQITSGSDTSPTVQSPYQIRALAIRP